MITKDSKEAKVFTEIDEILKYCSEDVRNKIPREFMNFIQENKCKDYIFKFDKEKTIDEQNILEETKIVLTVIYREFLCSNEEKNEINKILLKNEEIFQKEQEIKYSTENLFNKTKLNVEDKKIENSEQLGLVKYKENILKKFLNKILSILKKDNERKW